MVSLLPRALIAAALVALGACGHTPPAEVVHEAQPVPMPYPVIVVPAPELMAGLTLEVLPTFIAPTDAGALACLDKAGIDALRAVTIDLRSGLEAWETWGRSLYESHALEERKPREQPDRTRLDHQTAL